MGSGELRPCGRLVAAGCGEEDAGARGAAGWQLAPGGAGFHVPPEPGTARAVRCGPASVAGAGRFRPPQRAGRGGTKAAL